MLSAKLNEKLVGDILLNGHSLVPDYVAPFMPNTLSAKLNTELIGSILLNGYYESLPTVHVTVMTIDTIDSNMTLTSTNSSRLEIDTI